MRKSNLNNPKKMDSLQDLSKGDRQYLGRKGISGRKFDEMSAEDQNEWKDEMENPSYDRNDSKRNRKNKFKY